MDEMIASVYVLLVTGTALMFVYSMGWLGYQLVNLVFKSKE